MTELLPVPKNIPESPTCVFAQANPSKGCNDPWIADFLFTWLKQVSIRGKGISRIPEYGLIGIMANFSFAGMIGIVLMDNQIDH